MLFEAAGKLESLIFKLDSYFFWYCPSIALLKESLLAFRSASEIDPQKRLFLRGNIAQIEEKPGSNRLNVCFVSLTCNQRSLVWAISSLENEDVP